RHSLGDDLSFLADPSGLRALSAAKSRGLSPVLGGREAHPVRDIGYVVAVRINPKFINRLGREGDVGGGSWRVHADGRMHVHNQDRFASIPRLWESKQIGEVQAGIPVGESKVGAGIMVGHSFSSF